MSLFTKKKVQSLYRLCLRKLENNPNLIIKPLNEKVPYYLVESVVKRCTPEQLLKLEKFNESYREDTQELWKFHCKGKFTDIRNECEEGKLDDVEDWRDLYWKRQQTENARLERIKEKMKSSYNKLEKTKQRKSIKLNENLRPKMRSFSSPSYSSNSSGSSLKVKRNASLMQRARAAAKRSSMKFDFPPIQNHSVSSSSERVRSRSPPNSTVSVSASSSARHGKSLNSLKSRFNSKTASSSDYLQKRKQQQESLSDNKRQRTEKKVSSSSWDASSSFFSNF
ncbi:hypothetical protein BCR36DRAFT_346476 [Piromyces finnis]|uniref:Elongin-A n=1 Tax=Piromyces finnis TaxID=1754191 RepID=A0A1Y1VHY1_9FUNG|nr:hypothetical protein BCR36DRAFT_346476 [Piromyces finnis]|eukprot:ORX55994.1 hypothetical protein BCR36DRAFT_346476 [Piromyces finnis]